MKHKIPPKPASLIHSLRSIGYSFSSAVADIIDNSISAMAAEVRILFDINGQSCIFAIIDDGAGMSQEDLIEAMRPGSESPLTERDKSDLGRFGLGLKTASFSICKELTVISRIGGSISAARWDLDEVENSNEWDLTVFDRTEAVSLPFADMLGANGTAVVWSKIDRLFDSDLADISSEIYEKVRIMQEHLELTFHRYLQGERGIKKLSISINGDLLKPFDPFNSKNEATQRLPDDVLQVKGEKISITPYILPHHNKVSRAEYEKYAGNGGYINNQGFYVYRNKRLIIYGTWFRLADKENMNRLARVKIDIPNDVDLDWNIDIKKATANPPAAIKNRLKKTIERITGKSADVYRKRGARLTDKNIIPFWIKSADKNAISYAINREHPLVGRIAAALNDADEKNFFTLLEFIERCFPTDALFSDYSSSPKDFCQNELDEDKVIELAQVFVGDWTAQGIPSDEIIARMEVMDPFRKFMDQIKTMLDDKDV